MSQDMVEVIINDRYCGKIDRTSVMGQIVGLGIKHLEYMSANAMRDWILESCNLIEETFDWKVSTSIKKKVNYIRDYFIKNTELDRMRMQQMFINVMLSSEGLGLLRGFGYGEIGSKYQTNPEVRSTHNA